MAPAKHSPPAGSSDVRTDEQGRQWIDIEDPDDALRRRLNPTTGTEAEQQWPAPEPEEDAPPLIDLELAWNEVAAATLLTVDENEPIPDADSVEARNAIILVRELRAHILASTALPQRTGEQTESWDGSAATQGGESEHGDEPAEEEHDGQPKSVYGASVLLKLQWEDRSKQKAIPQRTYKELALFISDITMKLDSLLEKNSEAGKEVIDSLAMELTPLLFARYLDGIETCTDVLEDCCYALLTLCAERANPKIMHLAMKSFVSKVNKVYLEATAYLLVQPLVVLWGKVLPRIPRKRRAFLADFVKTYDLLKPLADSYQSAFVPEFGGVGVEREGRISRVPEVLLDFFSGLVETQRMQRETDSKIALEVDVLGREKARAQATSASVAEAGAEPPGEQQDGGTSHSDETVDWVRERGMTLARVLLMQSMLWTRLDPPAGEDRNVPKSKVKRKKREKNRPSWIVSSEEKEQSLASCLTILHKLGWDNPVLACQVGSVGVNLEPVSRSQEVLRKHIGEDIRSKKERKNTLYSIASVGYFLCSSLRHGTRSRVAKRPVDEGRSDYDVDLNGTAFELLEAQYAFDLVLPYLMNLVAQGHATISMSAICTLRAFLDKIPDGNYRNFSEVLRLRTGSKSTGRTVCLNGVCHHLTRSIAALDDPKHRRKAYETLQAVLRKCSDVKTRYTICESLFYDARRPVVAGQLLTEMKNVVLSADKDSWEKGILNAVEANSLRNRFAELCFQRYFIPRKELLAHLIPVVTTASMLMFLAGSDKRFYDKVSGEHEKLGEEIQKRMRFCKEYGKVGKECIRALGAVAHHDRKSVPSSQLAKENRADAMALFAASGRSLNQCIGACLVVDSALKYLG